ncbi:MAG: NTE family protein [Cyclobacteriaceae bacterium]|jgi:NTE family protein
MRNTIIVFSLLVSLNSSAQERIIKNLVFEGAGMRGLAYAGVIGEFESQGLMEQVEKVGGTSAGALTAMMISIGYNSIEIDDILRHTEFQKFNDGVVGAISRMNKNFGWFHGEAFMLWIESHIESKTGNAEITFSELIESGFLPLYITTTCVNKQKLYVLSHETYPNMKVKDAVRASVSIPLYFKAVFINEQGTSYPNYEDRKDLDILVDGGIVGNYPIFLFDSLAVSERNEVVRFPNYETLGFRIDSEAQIKQDSIVKEITSQEIFDFKDYFAALYNFTMESLNRNQMTPDDWSRTVSISSVGIGPMIKKFSDIEKNALVQSGRTYTSKYITENGLLLK